MFGSHGSLLEYRAALMASHGFVTLALAFFAYKDLPNMLDDLDLEYFIESAQWLSEHDKVIAGGVGFLGVSFGSMIALKVASECSLVSAVVGISTLHFLERPFKYKNRVVGWHGYFDSSKATITDGSVTTTDCYELDDQLVVANEIEVEDMKGPVMLLSGEHDGAINASESARRMITRTSEKGGPKIVHISYPKTGHLIEPPFMPMCSVSFHKTFGGRIRWGGEIVEHSAAQEHAWRSALNFLGNNVARKPPTSRL